MGITITILILLIVSSAILNRWERISLKNFEYKRYLDKERVLIKEPVRLTTEMTNHKLLFLPWIEVNANIPKEIIFKNQRVVSHANKNENIYSVVTSLLSYQRIKRHYTIYCSKRGYYSFSNVRLSIGDLFGFAVANKDIHYPMSLIVYPEVKPLRQLLVPFKSIQGEVSVRRWISPDNIAVIGAREYTSDDSFNTIDWKATARTNTLHVKKLDYTADPSMLLLLNVQTNDIYWQDVDGDIIEKGVDIAASITQKAIDEKVDVGFSSNAFFYGDKREIFIKPKNSRNQKMIIFDALAKTSYLPIDNFTNYLEKNIRLIDKNSVILIITSHISKDLIKKTNHMIKCGYCIKLILLKDSLNTEGLSKEVDIAFSYNYERNTK